MKLTPRELKEWQIWLISPITWMVVGVLGMGLYALIKGIAS